MTIRRTLFWSFIFLVIFSVWFAYNHPDWIVAGPPKDFQFNQVAAAQDRTLVQPTTPEKPVTSTPQQTSNPSAPVNKPQPKPADPPKPAASGRPDDAQYDVLAGGFENRCYYLGPTREVLYTTVIMSGYDPNDHTTFPYKGELDDHNAPATAAGSQAWCEANDPYKAER